MLPIIVKFCQYYDVYVILACSPSLSCYVILQDAVTLWDNEAVDGKEKIRHVFLFPDQMVMTKPSKSANIEEYEYKNTCQVCTLILN